MQRYRVAHARQVRGAARVSPGIVAVGLLALSALTVASPLRAQQPARTWCVTAMDDDHKPVTGLGQEDFALKDGGARQPVVSVEPATGPIAIGLVFWGPLMGTSGVGHELNGLNPASRVVANAAIAASDQKPGFLLQSIEQVAATVSHTQGFERRAIILVVSAAIPARQLQAVTTLAQVVERSETPLWTVETVADTDGPPRSAAQPRPRTAADDILDAAVAVGGGMRWRVKTGDELADGAVRVAALLSAAQYFVTANLPAIYTPPAPIATRHDRGVVLVPAWPR